MAVYAHACAYVSVHVYVYAYAHIKQLSTCKQLTAPGPASQDVVRIRDVLREAQGVGDADDGCVEGASAGHTEFILDRVPVLARECLGGARCGGECRAPVGRSGGRAAGPSGGRAAGWSSGRAFGRAVGRHPLDHRSDSSLRFYNCLDLARPGVSRESVRPDSTHDGST